MNLTSEDKRSLAGLKTIQGYHILLALIDEQVHNALERVRTARTDGELVETGRCYQVWQTAAEIIRKSPDAVLEELKEERDEIYG